MFCCPKSGEQMRRDAHKMIVDKLSQMHEQMKGIGCDCEKKEEGAAPSEMM